MMSGDIKTVCLGYGDHYHFLVTSKGSACEREQIADILFLSSPAAIRVNVPYEIGA